MPRDYAKSKKPKPKSSNKGLWWILSLIIILLLFILGRTFHHPHNAKPNKIISKITVLQQKAKPEANQNEVRFDFDTILTKEQVDVSQASSTTNQNAKIQYRLQVAAVQDEDDAKRLQSELALMGFNVYIDQIQAKGEVWNRINIGPYFSKKAAQADQQKLTDNNIKSELYRLKK